ncbi:MAG: putative Ig domain-containing protein, partial [Ignisphaera sp.]|nr:putative Ig domain-containing protein [Ignisphaera sp.]
ANHSVEIQQLIQSLAADLRTCLDVVDTDGTYGIAFDEPRYTIVPYSSGRPIKVRPGQALSHTFLTSGGEVTSLPVWSMFNSLSWLSLDSVTGALTGIAPVITQTTFNVLTGGSATDLSETPAPLKLSCKNAFGEAVNGPLAVSIKIIDPSTLVVSSGSTASGDASAHTFATYTIAAAGATSFVCYGLSQLPGLTLNPATGAISGTLAGSVVAGTYELYVAAVNAYGEGEDKLVTVTIAE